MPAFTGHASGLDTLASSGSCHRAKAAAFRCMSGSSRCRLTRPNVGDPLPSLHEHYTRFITTTEQSAPLRRIGTFGLAVGAACAFSLGIAGQVLTFHTRARLSFAPSTCRMPLGPSQVPPPFLPRLIRFRHFIRGSLALASLNHACRNPVPTFPQRSPPSLLRTAV